jgi:two-component system response regulator YesN
VLYRLLIAEDEEIISQGLLTTVNWSEYGFKPVAVAENGRKALELFHLHKPDVILTDIRMPLMDGLELLEAVHKISKGTQVVLVSGYKEFTYAKKGIEHGAFAYLLKDSLHEDIAKCFPRLREHMDSIRASQKNNEIRIINNCLQLDSDVEFPLGNYSCFSSIAIWISPEKNIKLPPGGDSEKRFYFSKTAHCVYICILGSESEHAVQRQINFLIPELLEINIPECFIGVGDIVKQRNNISRCYLEAMKALDHARLFQKPVVYYRRIFPLQDAGGHEEVDNYFPEVAIMLCDKPALIRYIHALYEESIKSPAALISDLHVSYIRIFEKFFYYTEILGGETDHVSRYLNTIHTIDSYIDCKKWTIETVSELCEILEKYRIGIGQQGVKRAVKLVDDHFMDELRLEEVARYCYMTTSGFSVKFKQVTGHTFSDYLRERRINYACHLLETRELKIYEIAHRCGYEDEKYFCRVFKLITGLSPSDFRQKHEQHKE